MYACCADAEDATPADAVSPEPVAPPCQVEMVVVKDDSEQDGPPPTKVESEPAGAAVSTRASFCSRLFASLRLDEKEADVFTVRAQVVLITLAMGVAEIDDCTLRAPLAV